MVKILMVKYTLHYFMDPFSLVSIARIKYSLESTSNRHSLLFKEEKVLIRVEEKIPIPGDSDLRERERILRTNII